MQKHIIRIFVVLFALSWAGVALGDGDAVLVPDRHQVRLDKVAPHRGKTPYRHVIHLRHSKGVKVTVPELDPGAAGSAITLLLGSLALMVDRRRRSAPV